MPRALFILLLVVVGPLVAGAAEPNHSWEALMQSVTVGRPVVVTRMNSAVLEGRLLAIDATSLRMRWKREETVIPRADVYRVRYANIRRRNTLIGMAIGAGGGAVIGAAAAGDAGGAGMAVIGVGLGALAGGVLPIGAPLYQAPGVLRAAQP